MPLLPNWSGKYKAKMVEGVNMKMCIAWEGERAAMKACADVTA